MRERETARGYANAVVSVIDAEACGYCHPAQSKRTKCVCGKVVRLHSTRVRCACGRLHARAPGAAFASTGFQPVRAGGRAGCPGVPE